MSYVLNQYNQPIVDKSDTSSSDNIKYMIQLGGATPRRKDTNGDIGVSGDSNTLFYNECIQFTSRLEAGNNYYFHCKIKRMLNDQIFYIYLINFEDDPSEEAPSQYLKTITIKGGNVNTWVDFELIFSPLLSFDCILFELQRTIYDYRTAVRYPVICYEELSKIQNFLANQIVSNTGLIKMGIQSRPGLMMCLNGEEIHVGRSGIYEVRNGIITVDFLSIIVAATENKDGPDPLINPNTGQVVTLDGYLRYMASLPIVEGPDDTNSRCIFEKSKERQIDAFTLDYMYEVEEE